MCAPAFTPYHKCSVRSLWVNYGVYCTWLYYLSTTLENAQIKHNETNKKKNTRVETSFKPLICINKDRGNSAKRPAPLALFLYNVIGTAQECRCSESLSQLTTSGSPSRSLKDYMETTADPAPNRPWPPHNVRLVAAMRTKWGNANERGCEWEQGSIKKPTQRHDKMAAVIGASRK